MKLSWNWPNPSGLPLSKCMKNYVEDNYQGHNSELLALLEKAGM